MHAYTNSIDYQQPLKDIPVITCKPVTEEDTLEVLKQGRVAARELSKTGVYLSFFPLIWKFADVDFDFVALE